MSQPYPSVRSLRYELNLIGPTIMELTSPESHEKKFRLTY